MDNKGFTQIGGEGGAPWPKELLKEERHRIGRNHKLRILKSAESGLTTTEIGAQFQRDGKYLSHLTRHHRQRVHGAIFSLTHVVKELSALAMVPRRKTEHSHIEGTRTRCHYWHHNGLEASAYQPDHVLLEPAGVQDTAPFEQCPPAVREEKGRDLFGATFVSFIERSPRHVWVTLLDEGLYQCCWSKVNDNFRENTCALR